ncbi:hypothetical protein LCGC14_2479950, partial [marine sediment metagenome]
LEPFEQHKRVFIERVERLLEKEEAKDSDGDYSSDSDLEEELEAVIQSERETISFRGKISV